jgi:hypothetical protein
MSKKKKTSKAKVKKTESQKSKVVQSKAKKASVENNNKTVEKKNDKAVSKSTIKIDKSKAKGFLRPLVYVLVLFFLLLAVDFFVQYLNNHYSIAVVEGKRISRAEYIDRLEDLYGEQVANMLVEEEVINQLAREEGVTVEKEDIDAKYDEIAQEFGGREALAETLTMYDMTEQELRDQLENEIILEKIIVPTLEYTDEDLEAFFEQNKEFIYDNVDEVTFEEEREDIEVMYIQQKVFEQRESLLNEFRGELSIQLNTPNAREEGEGRYGIFKATRNILSNLFSSENVEEQEED